MGQLEKLQTAREQIKSMQHRQDNTVEQLLLEMQRRQWLSDRGLLEKREIMVALTEVQRAKARGLDDRKREELVSLEQERLNMQERERDYISSIYQRDLVKRQSEMLNQVSQIQQELQKDAKQLPEEYRVSLKEHEERLRNIEALVSQKEAIPVPQANQDQFYRQIL